MPIRDVKFISILVLLALLCEPAFCQTTATEWYMKGMDLYSQGNYAGAIQAYDKAIEIDPQYADAWAYKSNALRQLGRATDAMEADAAYEKMVDAPGYRRPLTTLDWSSEGDHLKAQGKYEEAIQAYNKAIDIDPEDVLGWSLKADLLKMLGRTSEADSAYSKIKELKAASTTSIIDHSMANDVDESTNSVIKRTADFSINDSKAYSWLSLRNVPGGSTVWWYWYSPAGDLLYQDKVQIPQPTSGDHWNTYNVLSHIIIAGNYPANLSGDWHADIYLKGDKILTEYFSISGGQPPITSEKQYLYNPGKSGEAANKDLDDQGKSNDVAYTTYTTYTTQYNNKGKKNEAIGKADRLNAEGRYDEAIHFYDEAINIDPNNFANWQIWKSKGDALSKQGKYEEAIQAYDKALELAPEISIIYTGKGKALKALGRTNESDVVYATARELGDRSTWVPKTNATPINLTSLFHTEILDHSMSSNVDESTNDVVTRTSTFSSSDSKIYSWLILGRNLGATVKWHWYSPDGNPYKTGQVDVPRNPSGGYWPSRNVWYYLDTASIPTEPYMSGNWHVDIYIGNQKRLTEQFTLKMGSGKMEIGPSTEPGSSAAHGTFKVLDHAMASKVDDATNKPVTTTKTHEFKSSMTPYSWLSLGNIGVARIEWYWHNGVQEIRHTYDIPPNPRGGYYTSYNAWDFLDIPGMLQDFELGEIDEESARESAEIYAESGHDATYSSNPIPDPRGDWTIDVYVNDQWLLQEDFTIFSG